MNILAPRTGALQMNLKTKNGNFLENYFDETSVIYENQLLK
jgi:hypothetical protein